MRSLCILLSLLFISESFGDMIDRVLSRAVDASDLIQDMFGSNEDSGGRGSIRLNNNNNSRPNNNNNYYYSRSNNQIINGTGDYRVSNGFYASKGKAGTNPLKFRRSVPMLKKVDLFPKERVKTVDVSPDGRRIAYMFDDGKSTYIRVISLVNTRGQVYNIRSEYPINNFAFVGDNIIYTYYDENNFLKVKVFSSRGSTRQLELPDNLVKIKFFKGRNACLAECYDGEKYVLYRIDVVKFECQEIRELSEPINSIFDKNLKLLLIIKKENGQTNIYVEPKKKNQRKNQEEQDVDLGVEENMLVESIENDNEARYISADSEGGCYRIGIQKPQNVFLIDRVNPYTGENREMFRLKGVSNLSMCKVNLDQNGVPSFVTVNNRRYQHYSLNNNTKVHLDRISKYFNAGSWYRISITNDGMIWLICAKQDKFFDRFFLYDIRTGNFRNVTMENTFSRNFMNNRLYLRSTECHFLPTSEGEYTQIFLTRGVNHTINSPTVIMTNSKGQYNWGYNPIVQVLANRGYNVVCLNCNRYDLSTGVVEEFEEAVRKASSDIVDTVKWLLKNNVARQGNIILLAKKHSVVPAMQAFTKNQHVFGGYLALGLNEKDIRLLSEFELGDLKKPVIIMGRFNNSEAINELKDKLAETTSSIVSDNRPMSEKLVLGIVETFLAKRFNNPVSERLLPAEINSLDMIMDGLALFEVREDGHVYQDQNEDTDFISQYGSL